MFNITMNSLGIRSIPGNQTDLDNKIKAERCLDLLSSFNSQYDVAAFINTRHRTSKATTDLLNKIEAERFLALLSSFNSQYDVAAFINTRHRTSKATSESLERAFVSDLTQIVTDHSFGEVIPLNTPENQATLRTAYRGIQIVKDTYGKKDEECAKQLEKALKALEEIARKNGIDLTSTSEESKGKTQLSALVSKAQTAQDVKKRAYLNWMSNLKTEFLKSYSDDQINQAIQFLKEDKKWSPIFHKLENGIAFSPDPKQDEVYRNELMNNIQSHMGTYLSTRSKK